MEEFSKKESSAWSTHPPYWRKVRWSFVVKKTFLELHSTTMLQTSLRKAGDLFEKKRNVKERLHTTRLLLVPRSSKIPDWFENTLFTSFLKSKSSLQLKVFAQTLSPLFSEGAHSLFKSIWDLGASGHLETWCFRISPHLPQLFSSMLQRSFAVKLQKRFCALRNFTWLSIGIGFSI